MRAAGCSKRGRGEEHEDLGGEGEEEKERAAACGICGDDFDAMEPRAAVSRLTCGHCFCSQCIRQWFGTAAKNSCPTCRRVYSGLRSAETTTAGALARSANALAGPVNAQPWRGKKQKQPRDDPKQTVNTGRPLPTAVAEKQRNWLKKASRSRGRSSAFSLRTGVSALVFLQRECQARGLAPNGSKSLLAEQLARAELHMAPIEDTETEIAFALNEIVVQLEEDAMDALPPSPELRMQEHHEIADVQVATAVEAVVRHLEHDTAKPALHRLCLLAQQQQADEAVAWMFRERVVAKDRDELGQMQWLELRQFLLHQQKHRRLYSRVTANYEYTGEGAPSLSLLPTPCMPDFCT